MTDSRPELALAHSPDPDDAFMWWPLASIDGQPPALDTGRFRFRLVEDDIESLNQRAPSGQHAITAMSCAQYPYVHETYAITSCGASMGDAYGPKLVAREAMTVDELRGREVTIAVPGERTSALATTRLLLGVDRVTWVVEPFEQIIDLVASGRYEVGLIIHEGQLTFEDSGLHLIEDVGRWWTAEQGVPLPLGVNAIRRDLEEEHGPGTLREVTTLLRRSVDFALANRERSIEYALRFARGMSAALADEFVGMYVNKFTLEFGDTGEAAVARFLGAMAEAGIAPRVPAVDFIEPEAAASA